MGESSTYWTNRYRDEIREYEYHLREGIVPAFFNRFISFHLLTGLVVLWLPFVLRRHQPSRAGNGLRPVSAIAAGVLMVASWIMAEILLSILSAFLLFGPNGLFDPFVISGDRGGFVQVPFAVTMLKSKLHLFGVCIAYLAWVFMLAAWFGDGKRGRIILGTVVLFIAGCVARVFGEDLPDPVWWLFFTHLTNDFTHPAEEGAFTFFYSLMTLFGSFVFFTMFTVLRKARKRRFSSGK
jgi:hypothetical protein